MCKSESRGWEVAGGVQLQQSAVRIAGVTDIDSFPHLFL